MTTASSTPSRSCRPGHGTRVFAWTLFSGFPAVALALFFLWRSDLSNSLHWTFALAITGCWLALALVARSRLTRPLQTISNVLSALRAGDFAIRMQGARENDPLGNVIAEVNLLSETLREQRLGATEASTLLHTVMEEISMAVFAFDGARRLQLVNRAGERLLAQPQERLLGRNAADLGIAGCLDGEASRTLQHAFPGGLGRWGMRRTSFRQGGLPHQLVVLTDLSQALREEERLAWQRLLRVLGHELNNSLAPIKSISGSLEKLIASEARPSDWEGDISQGLAIISSRTTALTKFMEDYSRLAKLPPPHPQAVELEPLLLRVVSLEQRLPVKLEPGPALQLQADPVQLEQLLINVVRNAVDAVLGRHHGSNPEAGSALPGHPGVVLSWRLISDAVEIRVEDDGPGIASTANLFVPFFTTKPGGSGIGLVLSRQIAEAHGGSLTLENRLDHPGCVACVRLPRV
jgi:nitrogen fixation/metabolism regulation signal transduction histidine kinase